MTAFIHDNIEYVMPTVFKATEYDWARDLIDSGTVYFTNIQQFIDDSHDERGDANEGKPTLIRQGVRCVGEYSMPCYIWCCTMDSQACRVMNTWPDKDTVIQIRDTVAFARRITAALATQCPKFGPLKVGPAVYTKTRGGFEETDWADGLFQKDERYDHQKEFRFALTAHTGDSAEDHIVLNLGPCHDIVRVVLRMNPESEQELDRLTGTPLKRAGYLDFLGRWRKRCQEGKSRRNHAGNSEPRNGGQQ